MKDYNYWIKAIERDILEPDKIHIHLGHLKQSLLNSGYPLLADVLAEIDERVSKRYGFYGWKSAVEEVLSKYFS